MLKSHQSCNLTDLCFALAWADGPGCSLHSLLAVCSSVIKEPQAKLSGCTLAQVRLFPDGSGHDSDDQGCPSASSRLLKSIELSKTSKDCPWNRVARRKETEQVQEGKKKAEFGNVSFTARVLKILQPLPIVMRSSGSYIPKKYITFWKPGETQGKIEWCSLNTKGELRMRGEGRHVERKFVITSGKWNRAEKRWRLCQKLERNVRIKRLLSKWFIGFDNYNSLHKGKKELDHSF